jgi:hypothetical protein
MYFWPQVQYVHNWWCSFNCSVADPDPDPDPLVRGMDPDLGLDPSNIQQN